MTTAAFTKDTLLNVGFVDVARWLLSGEQLKCQLDGEHVAANRLLLEEPNVLYAFVQDEEVQYIGKTTRSVRKRFAGYQRPGRTQRTNVRCNRNIKEALKGGAEIRILVFAPISDLRYREYEINLAAGLEDSLIKAFDPPWNGREKNEPITEEAEREEAEENADGAAAEIAAPDTTAVDPISGKGLASFRIALGQAYYHQGLINPGVDASRFLGTDGEPIQVLFDDGSEPVLSRINRTANPSGAVRIVGRNREIADWFQRNFSIGDTVHATVIDPNRIRLFGGSARSRL